MPQKACRKWTFEMHIFMNFLNNPSYLMEKSQYSELLYTTGTFMLCWKKTHLHNKIVQRTTREISGFTSNFSQWLQQCWTMERLVFWKKLLLNVSHWFYSKHVWLLYYIYKLCLLCLVLTLQAEHCFIMKEITSIHFIT